MRIYSKVEEDESGRGEEYHFRPIGVLNTVFKEKFGIPRQSGLVGGAEGVIKLNDDPALTIALRALDTFSHLWVVFVFHRHDARNWKPSIRPPRLGGAKKVGVLASRSPHRPNPIGLSAVKIERIIMDAPGGAEIHVSGVDVLDGTPVLDIKPYVPYADVVENASGGWAAETIPRQEVVFTDKAVAAIARWPEPEKYRAMIEEMISLDPRPASQRRRLPVAAPETQGTRYGIWVMDGDVQWEIRDGRFFVTDVIPRS